MKIASPPRCRRTLNISLLRAAGIPQTPPSLPPATPALLEKHALCPPGCRPTEIFSFLLRAHEDAAGGRAGGQAPSCDGGVLTIAAHKGDVDVRKRTTLAHVRPCSSLVCALEDDHSTTSTWEVVFFSGGGPKQMRQSSRRWTTFLMGA